jgi:hypothetical protein
VLLGDLLERPMARQPCPLLQVGATLDPNASRDEEYVQLLGEIGRDLQLGVGLCAQTMVDPRGDHGVSGSLAHERERVEQGVRVGPTGAGTQDGVTAAE